MKQKEPDHKKILDYISTGRSLTWLQCFVKFGCKNLAGRIFDLKKMGHHIDGLPVKLESGKFVKKYFLVEKYRGTDYVNL